MYLCKEKWNEKGNKRWKINDGLNKKSINKKFTKNLTGTMLAQGRKIFVIKALQSLKRHIDSKTCKQKQYKYHYKSNVINIKIFF